MIFRCRFSRIKVYAEVVRESKYNCRLTALLIEKLQSGTDKAYALFWTPISREQLDELEYLFRRAALKRKLSETADKVKRKEFECQEIQRQIERYKKECESLRDAWERESRQWEEIQKNRIAKLNQLIESGEIIQSKYICSEKALENRANGYELDEWNYKTAAVLQAFMGNADGDEMMLCRIRFGGGGSRVIFDAFEEELLDLLDYLKPCKGQMSF